MAKKFKLSKRSLKRLEGVHPALVAVILRAHELTGIDFGIAEGVRTLERQQELVNSRASWTMNSRHIPKKPLNQVSGEDCEAEFSHAIDLHAYIGKRVHWEWGLYFQIAEAMRQAARELGVAIQWGGIWDRNLNSLDGSLTDHQEMYIQRFRHQRELRNQKVRNPKIDGPHFQLSWREYPIAKE